MIVPDASSVRLTDRARARIAALSSGRVVRLYAERGGAGELEMGLSFDDPRSGDLPIADEAVRLVTDPASLRVLEGRVLDYEESGVRRGFSLAPAGIANSDRFSNSYGPEDPTTRQAQEGGGVRHEH